MSDDHWRDVMAYAGRLADRPRIELTPLGIQLWKLMEESGELAEAHIGRQGLNPRKADVVFTDEDETREICDVIVTAMTALAMKVEDPEARLSEHFESLKDRTTFPKLGSAGPM